MSLSYQELRSMGPGFPFAIRLREDFGVAIPPGAPKYQAEYLYKYARTIDSSISKADIIELAAAKAAALFQDFPWLSKKYEDVTRSEKTATRKVVGSLARNADYPDGSIGYCTRRARFVCYVGKIHVASAKTEAKVKASVLAKFPGTIFTSI